MLPYATGLILDNNNYGIVKTETVFVQQNPNFLNVSYNNTEPLEWMFTPVNVEKTSSKEQQKPRNSRSLKTKNKKEKIKKHKNKQQKKFLKKLKKKNKRTGKVKKCIVKFMNKDKRMKRRRNKSKFKMGKKLMIPLILGLMAAKSVLIPVALKALAFISAKGFLMGFFSTILASFLSLKGMFDHSGRYQRRDDDKTQVEIIQVPAAAPKDEHHYYDEHFRRGDYGPGLIPVVSQIK